MKTSAPASASDTDPGLAQSAVLLASHCLTSFRLSRDGWITPWRSTTLILRTPADMRILVIATPAAPAPEMTTLQSSRSRSVSRDALSSPASTTTAVPCWSSWKTGMSRRSMRRRSISKQRGLAMSSRLMPPKVGASRMTVSTISSTSVVFSATGMASTPPNCLNRTALPSMTGIEAAGPMLPRPSTAVPSVTTATVLETQVYSWASSGSAKIASQTRATPGVYDSERSLASRSGTVEATSILPPRCSAKTGSSSGQGRPVGHRCQWQPSASRILGWLLPVGGRCMGLREGTGRVVPARQSLTRVCPLLERPGSRAARAGTRARPAETRPSPASPRLRRPERRRRAQLDELGHDERRTGPCSGPAAPPRPRSAGRDRGDRDHAPSP